MERDGTTADPIVVIAKVGPASWKTIPKFIGVSPVCPVQQIFRRIIPVAIIDCSSHYGVTEASRRKKNVVMPTTANS